MAKKLNAEQWKSIAEKMKLTFEVVDTALAEIYLSKVAPDFQRKWSATTVSQLARSMQAGLWQLCLDPIVIDLEGRLINGQHRLRAILRSGTPCTLLVIRGAPPELIHVMDHMRKRTLVDSLYINKRPQPKLRGPVVNALISVVHKKQFASTDAGLEVEKIYEQELNVVISIYSKVAGLNVAGIYAAAALCLRADPNLLEDFLIPVIKGGPANHSPAYFLREAYLLKRRAREETVDVKAGWAESLQSAKAFCHMAKLHQLGIETVKRCSADSITWDSVDYWLQQQDKEIRTIKKLCGTLHETV